MKTYFFLATLVLISLSNLSASSCGNLIFNNQADINAFTACDSVMGIVRINSASTSDISDLSPLADIEYISGNLLIINTSMLTSLKGLENLTDVDGLRIMGNTNLVDISALNNINIENELRIEANGSLNQCCFLKEQLDKGIPTVMISNNDKLSGCNMPLEISNDTRCDIIVKPVPTIGQWGLIILGQLLMIMSIVRIRELNTVRA